MFIFWDFEFKVYNAAWIMHIFVIFSPLSLSGLKIKYSIILEDDFINFIDYVRVP